MRKSPGNRAGFLCSEERPTVASVPPPVDREQLREEAEVSKIACFSGEQQLTDLIVFWERRTG
jgi:hypothetical protein